MCAGEPTIYLGRDPFATVDIWWTGAAGVTTVLPVRSGAKDGPYLLVPRDSLTGGDYGGANYVRIINVMPGTTTYYKLVAVYPEGSLDPVRAMAAIGAIVVDGKSKGTALSDVLTVTVPPKPEATKVTVDGRTLTWIGDPAVIRYVVERWSVGTGPSGGDVFQQRFEVPTVIGRMTFTDTGAYPGVYRYDVIGWYPDRRSGSLLVKVYTDAQIPNCF
jgi:hypothetical protein